jgi:hypothetical protein
LLELVEHHILRPTGSAGVAQTNSGPSRP